MLCVQCHCLFNKISIKSRRAWGVGKSKKPRAGESIPIESQNKRAASGPAPPWHHPPGNSDIVCSVHKLFSFRHVPPYPYAATPSCNVACFAYVCSRNGNWK